MKRFAWIVSGFVAGMLIASAAVAVGQTPGSDQAGLTQEVRGGAIDWGNQTFIATGEGVMPGASEEPNRAKAYLKAKAYARMQAIANLLTVIEGTTVSYDAIGRDYMVQDETLRQRIEGSIRGVEVIKDEEVSVHGDPIVKVTVSTRMYGKNELRLGSGGKSLPGRRSGVRARRRQIRRALVRHAVRGSHKAPKGAVYVACHRLAGRGCRARDESQDLKARRHGGLGHNTREPGFRHRDRYRQLCKLDGNGDEQQPVWR